MVKWNETYQVWILSLDIMCLIQKFPSITLFRQKLLINFLNPYTSDLFSLEFLLFYSQTFINLQVMYLLYQYIRNER